MSQLLQKNARDMKLAFGAVFLLTWHKLSFVGSHTIDAHVLTPAPFFCMMIDVMMYL